MGFGGGGRKTRTRGGAARSLVHRGEKETINEYPFKRENSNIVKSRSFPRKSRRLHRHCPEEKQTFVFKEGGKKETMKGHNVAIKKKKTTKNKKKSGPVEEV